MTDTHAPAADAAGLGTFERWLSVWVGLCIAAGVGLGALAPGLFGALAALEVASVNLWWPC
jgi:ACR3 family arsenite transporter